MRKYCCQDTKFNCFVCHIEKNLISANYNNQKIFRKHENLDNILICGTMQSIMSSNKNTFTNYTMSTQAGQGGTYTFRNHGPVYLFTNENITGYMPRFGDITGARVLSVCASGDHAFESLLAGASHVDTFDINQYQNCVMELKSHLIRDVPYEKFMDFFFSTNHFFDYRIIRPLEHKFSPKLREFLTNYKERGRTMFHYFGSHAPAYNVFQLSYLADPNKYYQLREKLSDKVNFTHCDIYDVSRTFSDKYDVILLSNIMDYTSVPAGNYITYDVFMHFYNVVLAHLARKNLSPQNGQICFQYMWDVKDSKYWTDFLVAFQRDCLPSHQSLVGHKIKSIYRGEQRDMVICLRQNQKQK